MMTVASNDDKLSNFIVKDLTPMKSTSSPRLVHWTKIGAKYLLQSGALSQMEERNQN